MAADLEPSRRLLASLADTPPGNRWQMPFPLAVFGTLRAGFRNHHLMQLGRIAGRCLAFLPHFCARQIDLFFHANASAPFEIYFYEPADWLTLIEPLDRLEGFAAHGPRTGSYHRSLAWLSLLPDDYQHPAYAADMLDRERDLELDPASWPQYERVPCWLYSSIAENRRAASMTDVPLIWDGVVFS